MKVNDFVLYHDQKNDLYLINKIENKKKNVFKLDFDYDNFDEKYVTRIIVEDDINFVIQDERKFQILFINKNILKVMKFKKDIMEKRGVLE